MQAIIGIDISKAQLDVFNANTGELTAFSNDKRGLAQFKRWLAHTPSHIVFEATGHYHKTLERHLSTNAKPFTKVNPWQARRFKEALGKRAKTDRVDAQMLARMGQALDLEASQVKSELIEALEEIELVRDGLIKIQTAYKNRRQRIGSTRLIKIIDKQLKSLAKDLDTLESEADLVIADDQDIKQRFDILCSIPGIGAATARSLIAQMPELGAMGAKEAAALIGLAPITRQSGTWTGKAYIQGGRAEIRHKMFLPALVAIRHNPDLSTFYNRLINAGKPKKVAVVAVMRKLIITANALLRRGEKWINRAID